MAKVIFIRATMNQEKNVYIRIALGWFLLVSKVMLSGTDPLRKKPAYFSGLLWGKPAYFRGLLRRNLPILGVF